MTINTENLVSITETNQNFSRVARIVDKTGAVVVLKNNVPRYVILDFSQLLDEETASTSEALTSARNYLKTIWRLLRNWQSSPMKRLSQETIVAMHSELIIQSGGLDGIRDANMLDASINSPFHTFDGKYLYPTLQAMAAHLTFSLIKNHPFLDGNKQIGID